MTIGIRVEGCGNGTFWESEKKYRYDINGDNISYNSNELHNDICNG